MRYITKFIFETKKWSVIDRTEKKTVAYGMTEQEARAWARKLQPRKPRKLVKKRTDPDLVLAGEIKSIRSKVKMTSETFAHVLGFNKSSARATVYRWEKGLRVPSKQTMTLMRAIGASENLSDFF